MAKSDRVVAVLCSDLHLCHRPPAARSAESDWYAAMGRQLDQLTRLSYDHGCPVICAGDVFDRWDSPPELINFAMGRFSPFLVYAVPGQHDLPMHRLVDIEKSAYWTLVGGFALHHLDDGGPRWDDEIGVVGFPFGVEPRPWSFGDEDVLKVAVCHRYAWARGQGSYPGAPESALVGSLLPRLAGYDVVLLGDNHKTWIVPGKAGKRPTVFNPGALIPRTLEERVNGSKVGLLRADGLVEVVAFDTSGDRWVEVDPVNGDGGRGGLPDMGRFLEQLSALEVGPVDFRRAVMEYVDDPRNGVSSVVREAIMEGLRE